MHRRGFTLVETMVAISLLTVAIVAPMLLTIQSLSSAYYSRDQITAFYLAQEAIEEVHQIRDGQILQIAETADSSSINIFGPIPLDRNFVIDARKSDPAQAICECGNPACPLKPNGSCPYLQTDGTLYGYSSGWTDTTFTRTVRASFVGANPDELRVQVTVSWQTGAYQERTFTISEDLYRWVQDGQGL